MAKKIFISYKHKDQDVKPIGWSSYCTVRDYVDFLETHLKKDHIFKGEKDDEDLGKFKDETIESHLRNKIFDSSITIVLISKNMKEVGKSEDNQWIPWEIAYSLKEKTRENKTSTSNAMLAIILPDKNNNFSYFVEPIYCTYCEGTRLNTNILFSIIGNNMFNRKESKTYSCNNCGLIYSGHDHSYIYPVKWNDFIKASNHYINHCLKINENIADYDITKQI